MQPNLLEPVQPSENIRSLNITGTECTVESWRVGFGAQVLAESTAALQDRSRLRQNAEKMVYTLACLKVRPQGKRDLPNALGRCCQGS